MSEFPDLAGKYRSQVNNHLPFFEAKNIKKYGS